MSESNFAQLYKQASVSTASPGMLILMLFDGALQALHRAEHGFSLTVLSRRNEEIHNGLTRAHQIIRELQQSLDMGVETEFAEQMYAIYGFMLDRIFDANVKKEQESLPAVISMLKDLRDAWEEMLRSSPQEAR
ncbi:MAG: flagellar export chaperone FliS [Verrucomicrobia bacterium]|nr:flagellar export chaperone FliS [Verrucomicrobiota bacterium]